MKFKKMLCMAVAAVTMLGVVACGNGGAPGADDVTLAAKTSTMSAELTEKYAQEHGFKVVYYEDSPSMYQAV